MEFKVVPFHAVIQQNGTTSDIAIQLQTLIDEYALTGWEYVRMENVETFIAPDSGCFGFGGKPGYSKVFNMAVFKK